MPPPKTDEDIRERNEKKALDADLVKFTAWLFYATTATAVATVLLVVVTSALVYFGRIQSRDMRATVEIARNAYLAEHRTWLKVSPVEVGPITFNGDKIRATIILEAENVGNFPALNVHLACTSYQGRGYLINGIPRDRLVFEEKTLRSLPNASAGIILMPGEKHRWSFSADAETDEIIEAKIREGSALALKVFGVQLKQDQVTLSATYCAIYKSLASTEWHHSAYNVWIRKRDGSEFNPDLGEVAVIDIKATVSPYYTDMT
jgi:hypothetical protein